MSLFLVISLVSISITGCSNKNETKANPSPSSKPIPAEPFSFEDLISNPSSASYWAWKKSQTKINESISSSQMAKIESGPNSVPDNKNPQAGIDLASKLYSDFKQGQEVNLFYYQIEDVTWAQKKLNSYLGQYLQDWQKTQAEKMCTSERNCISAVTITHPAKPSAIMLITASEFGKLDVNHTSGTLEAHEYTHVIQDKLQGKFLGKIPRWHAEGEAEFSQAASVYNGEYQKYLTERSRIITSLIKNPEITESWLIDFLSPKTGLTNWQAWDKYDNWRLYDVGMLVTELLASIKGPESTMELSYQVGKGISYKTAFEKIYGVPWQKAVPLMAKIINAEINS